MQTHLPEKPSRLYLSLFSTRYENKEKGGVRFYNEQRDLVALQSGDCPERYIVHTRV